MINERTSLFLMANLGSETTRLISAREQNDYDNALASLTRAEKILDELTALPDMKNREEELQILRNSLKKLASLQTNHSITPHHLKSYFIPFAIRLIATR